MRNRRHQPGAAGGINLGLIITPMLDMAFQILAFFIMTYHPSALEGHIPVSLIPPEDPAKRGQENAKTDVAPLSVSEDDLMPELNEAILVKIRAVGKGQEVGNHLEGQPKQLFIKQATETEPQLIADVDVDFEVAFQRLDGKLKDLIKQGTAKKSDLKIECDSDLRVRYKMQVYDTCKKAGFDKIHFVPPPVLISNLK